jgi:transposase
MLAKALSEVGWYSLRTKIAYKAAMAGRHFVIDQWAHVEDVFVLRSPRS